MPQAQNIQVGFPPDLLGKEAKRLGATICPGKWIALEKPQEIEIRPDSGESHSQAPNLENALQAQRNLKSLEAFGFSADYKPKSIYQIDRDAYGFGLWALSDDELERLRNEYGSDMFSFRYEFLARETLESGAEYSVYLPIARHSKFPDRYVISTQTGKKADTEFKKIKTWEKAGVALWEAKTPRTRGHQIRLHAFECGLTILGEWIYTEDPGIALTDLKKKRVSKREAAQKPLWGGLNLRLASLDGASLPEEGISFPRPRQMSTLIRKLDQFS